MLRIGIVSISDRASRGEYQDEGIPALKSWLADVITSPFDSIDRLIHDDQKLIEETLIDLVDHKHAQLILTTGGTGPAIRDVTPEATLAVADKIMPGFGEQMRQVSLYYVPTAILSRQVAVVRKNSLIINLPGRPKAIQETLEGVRNNEGDIVVHGIFSAVPYCLDLIGAPYIETDPVKCKSFRPKK